MQMKFTVNSQKVPPSANSVSERPCMRASVVMTMATIRYCREPVHEMADCVRLIEVGGNYSNFSNPDQDVYDT